MELTIKEMAALGGKARWAKVSKKERIATMKELNRLSHLKKRRSQKKSK